MALSGKARAVHFALGAALVMSAVPGVLRAQVAASDPPIVVHGKVSSRESGAPLAGALVTLEDSTGVARLRVVTSPSGAYSIPAPSAGRWRLRVAAIGYDPSPARSFTLTLMGDQVVDVVMIRRPFQLPTLVVRGKGEKCFPDPVGDPIVTRLVGEAETALQLVEASIASHRLEFVTEAWQSRALLGSADTLRGFGRSQARASWPIASTDLELLRTGGFVRDTGGRPPSQGYSRDSGPIYYGPDASVLFSPWFRAQHCFALDQRAGGDSLVVRYTPKSLAKGRVDVEGALVLDRTTLALRRLVFRYVGLPGWVPRQRAGGEVSFLRLSTGLWAANSWQMRAPIQLWRRWGTGGLTLGGWAEMGGRVVEMWEAGVRERRPLADGPA
ncbi:MAG: carboxypeptidase-like regulatory domain-containing protein [Gemmatimonadota bacterium]